jgi:hypothetical protein
MASSSKKNHAYLYDKRVTSIAHHDRCHNHVVFPVCHDVAFAASHAPRRASTGPTIIYQTCMLHLLLHAKMIK